MMEASRNNSKKQLLTTILLWCLAAVFIGSLSACDSASPTKSKHREDTKNSNSEQEQVEKNRLSRNYKVMIDPGHGGSDPGATVDKLDERDYTLNVAQQVLAILQKNQQIDAKMTRSADIFVDLPERAELANAWQADIIVSIHGNTFTDETVSGTEVLYTHDDNSVNLAQSLQQSLIQTLGFRDRGIRKEQLIVLSHSTMPGALIEVGYLTNKAERKQMTSKAGQLKTAQAIADGIIHYFETLDQELELGLEPGTDHPDDSKERQEDNNATYSIDRKIYYNGKKEDGKQAALTFDDGPDQIATPQVLEILQRHNVKATFFMLGTQAKANPEMVQKIVDAGHVIGNHSWSHPNLNKSTMQEAKQQINDTQQILEDITGIRPILFRPPYGNLTEEQQSEVFDMGLAVVNWSVDTLDWKGASAKKIVETVHKEIWPGGIILQHNAGGKDHRANTIEALDTIITELQAEGYTFVTVPELLHLPDSLSP